MIMLFLWLETLWIFLSWDASPCTAPSSSVIRYIFMMYVVNSFLVICWYSSSFNPSCPEDKLTRLNVELNVNVELFQGVSSAEKGDAALHDACHHHNLLLNSSRVFYPDNNIVSYGRLYFPTIPKSESVIHFSWSEIISGEIAVLQVLIQPFLSGTGDWSTLIQNDVLSGYLLFIE